MNKDEVVAKLKDLIVRVDKREAAVDGVILSVAAWMVNKPWTARAVAVVAVGCLGFAIYKTFSYLAG